MNSLLKPQPLDSVTKDHLIYVILCVDDGTVLIRTTDENGKQTKYFPSTRLATDEGWAAAARRLSGEVNNFNWPLLFILVICISVTIEHAKYTHMVFI